MKFFLDKNTVLPLDAQIQEQIKLALLLGVLRSGDRVPSIRDLARQVGTNRGVVYKAYLQLHKSGILNLQHGQGVIIEEQLNYDHRRTASDHAEGLSQQMLAKLYKMGISPSAFSRYLYRKAREYERETPFIIFVDITSRQANERAAQISSLWQVPIEGFSLEEFPNKRPAP